MGRQMYAANKNLEHIPKPSGTYPVKYWNKHSTACDIIKSLLYIQHQFITVYRKCQK